MGREEERGSIKNIILLSKNWKFRVLEQVKDLSPASISALSCVYLLTNLWQVGSQLESLFY